MKIKFTKKGKIVLFVILGIIVLGSGGYLLWRVLQPETVAPGDSEAGGSYVYDCVFNCTGANPDTCYCECTDGVWVAVPCERENDDTTLKELCVGNSSISNCYQACEACGHGEEPPPGGGCTSGSQCTNKCYWPEVAYCNSSGSCVCRQYDSFSNPSCGISTPCTPECPTGYERTCPSGSTCTTTKAECSGKCPDCDNLYYNKITCYKPESTEENICEDSSWITKPSGTYESCQGIVASVEALDDDGVQESSISVKVNGQSKTGYKLSGTKGNIAITYEFSESDCSEPGEYAIIFTWKDGLGNSGSDCSLNTSFIIAEEGEPYCGDGMLVEGEQCELGNPTGYTCLWDDCNQESCICPEEQENPDWTIIKTGAGQCIEEEGETYAKTIYSITVTNIGDGEGSIDKIVDQPDIKILEEYINDISDSGIYATGLITWDLETEEEIFDSQESKSFTYYTLIPQESYGTYENTVTAYPTEGDNFSDDEDIDLQCEIEEEEEPVIPQTGIFDTVISKLLLGVILILLGINWPNISQTLMKLNYSVKEGVSERRTKRFERKVAKKK